MNILQYAAASQEAWAQQVAATSGYKRKTTFWQDFTIAEKMDGAKGIRDTYKRAFDSWKNDHVYMAELVLVLNHKIWALYESNEPLAKVYNDLWKETNDYVWRYFKGDAADYLFNVLD